MSGSNGSNGTTGRASGPRRRRSPVSRQEGERRLVAATLQLCRERPFPEVTVREIARAADMNHGFVHTWFGGKAGLVAAAVRELMDEMARRVRAGQVAAGGLRSADTVLLMRLLAWLEIDEAGRTFSEGRDRPVIELGAATLRDLFGFDEATALTLAELSAAIMAGFALVGEAVRLDEARATALWPEMIAALAAARGVAPDGAAAER